MKRCIAPVVRQEIIL